MRFSVEHLLRWTFWVAVGAHVVTQPHIAAKWVPWLLLTVVVWWLSIPPALRRRLVRDEPSPDADPLSIMEQPGRHEPASPEARPPASPAA